MPYNQHLAERIRTALETHPTIVEKKMFGGVGFMINGNLACGVQGEDMIVRVGVDNNDAALAQPHVRPFMVMPGKPMAGWVLVAPEGSSTEQDLERWVHAGYEYASSLPEK
jgi:TfoX/Sxy family transcriptional regulator of competence genes